MNTPSATARRVNCRLLVGSSGGESSFKTSQETASARLQAAFDEATFASANAKSPQVTNISIICAKKNARSADAGRALIQFRSKKSTRYSLLRHR